MKNCVEKIVNNWKKLPLRKSQQTSNMQFFSQFFFLEKKGSLNSSEKSSREHVFSVCEKVFRKKSCIASWKKQLNVAQVLICITLNRFMMCKLGVEQATEEM